MKKSIFALMVATIFAFSFMLVSCKKAEEAKPEEEAVTTEQPAGEAAKTDAKEAAKDVLKKAAEAGVDAAAKKVPGLK